MANLVKDELVLLKEVFNITLVDDEYVNKAATRMPGYSDEEVRLHSSKSEIENLGGTISIAQDFNLFENILIERLNVYNTEVFTYLSNCMDRTTQIELKAWNQTDEKKAFFAKAKELVNNYFALAITTPELFENSKCDVPNSRFQIEPQLLQNNFEVNIAYKFLQLMFAGINPNVLNNLWTSDAFGD